VSRRDIYANVGGLNKVAGDRNTNNAGIVFGRFYSTSAVCSPARASFMTGRHPTRLGVPKFDQPLDGTEVTIAEFLKQGCRDNADPLCVKDSFDGGEPMVEPCECYMPPSGDCSSDGSGQPCTCADAACYHTGIVGKWHIGLKTKSHWAPWQQGFDEFIGIGGGDRAQFNRRDLICSPGMLRRSWKCWDSTTGTFTATPCSDDATSNCASDQNWTCRADTNQYGLYIGSAAPIPAGACEQASAPTNADCCKPQGWKGGRYRFKDKPAFKVGNKVVAGRDRRLSSGSSFPCNNVGDVKDSKCLYATRWMRDYAKNFIARHAADAPPNGSRPFFLFVGFTAPHVPYSAPMRTIEHYRAPRGTLDEARIRAPKGKAVYWAMLEELDEAVGSIMAKLEETPGLRKSKLPFATTAAPGG